MSFQSKRKSEPIISKLSVSGDILNNNNSNSSSSSHSSGGSNSNNELINKLLSKSGGIDRPLPPPIENKPKRPLSLSISTLTPPTSPTIEGNTSGPNSHLGSSRHSSGNTSPISSTSISPSSSQLNLSRANFKMPPKSNSVLFSVIYDKTNSSMEYLDEEDLFQRISIQKLLLSRNKLIFLPERISELAKLTIIDLSYNRLKSLPVQLSQLTELTQLNLSGNTFMIAATKENELLLNNGSNNNNIKNSNSIENINDSTNTTCESSPINSSNNTILNQIEGDSSPNSIPLKLSNKDNNNTPVDESLNYIPWELSYVQTLKKLDLSSNQCRDDSWEGECLLPSSIFWLTQIETLLLSNCQLKSLNSDIQHLESLTHLDLSSNSLYVLPEEISQLYRLKTLNVNFNNLTAIPSSIGKLSETLTNLDLSNNKISTLPLEISYLSYLQNFNISNNEIEQIPDQLFPGYVDYNQYNSDSYGCTDGPGLYSLDTFKCRGNNISKLPQKFFVTCKDIRVLDLSVNKLKELPIEGIQELDNLSNLLLFNNQLKEIPDDLFENSSFSQEQGEDSNYRSNLTVVNLSGNQISKIPINMWRCKSLSHVSIAYNQLKNIEFPQDILAYYSLEELYLNGNSGITFTLPILQSSSCELFPSLRDLSLAMCLLDDIPSFIKSIKVLEKFDFSYNNLSNIPQKIFSELEHLQILLLAHNQISQLDPVLSSLKSLTLIDLSLNPIKDKSLNQLITSLPESIFILNSIGQQLNSSLDNSILTQANVHSAVIKESSRFKIYYSDMIGRRPTMEDAFSIHGVFSGQNTMDLISLFDGHAGSKAATYSAEHFPLIMKNLVSMFPSIPPLQWLRQAYSEITMSFRHYIQQEKPDLKYCGATAASVLLIDDYYCVSNIGDTRVVLCQDGKAKRLSFDHKPGDPGETRRISRLGGYVISNQHTSRVNGTLALSRSIGDFYMEPFVISDPYLSQTKRNHELDQFIIVACDGIWDEISDQQACDIVLSSKSMKDAVFKLKDYSYFSGSDDNISVILIDLKNQN